MGIRDRKEEIMTSSQIFLQVVVPDIGFAASIGPQAGSGASENRYGKGVRWTVDPRQV